MGATGQRIGQCGALAAAAGLIFVVLTAPNLGAQPVAPVAGDIVATELKAGRVEVIDATGRATVLVDQLQSPQGVAVLGDGSVLVAEYGANRVIGIAGRFGAAPKPIVSVDSPYGITIAADGTVYLSLLNKGEMGKLDVAAGSYTKLVGDLQGPSQIATHESGVVVAESTGGDVVNIAPDGAKTVVASGFQQPIGVANGPSGSLFVSDFKANKVFRLAADGKQTDFASPSSPVQLSVDPNPPPATGAYTVAVANADGVTRFDQLGKKQNTSALQVPIGVAFVGAITTAPPTSAGPTSSGPASSVSTPSSLPTTSRTPTTKAPAATTTTAPPASSSSSSTGLVLGGIAVIVLAIIAAVAFFVMRKPKGSAEAGFDVEPEEKKTVAEAFGPCASQEVELAEAESELRAILEQREAAEVRVGDAAERASLAREREAKASDARASAESERLKAGEQQKTESAPPEMRVDGLGLTTDPGREALAKFQRGEIDAHQLEASWFELGESTAIEAVRSAGERRLRSDPTVPWPEERRAAESEAEAHADLLRAERDRAEADADIARFAEREHLAMERIVAAREALAECQERTAREAEAKAAADDKKDDDKKDDDKKDDDKKDDDKKDDDKKDDDKKDDDKKDDDKKDDDKKDDDKKDDDKKDDGGMFAEAETVVTKEPADDDKKADDKASDDKASDDGKPDDGDEGEKKSD